ncbi:hypothetical protein F2P56_000698 [Juglans regia]|uniref:Uncharacterized protein LOC108987934 n=2 Tax=Juglans regia TaxID=51240 RepID=A0A2I4EAY1_JUGRE|nr:uncharacterized protein LOC108987934 [Juglans regia]KAF5479916.1 hypothetical protein F2P56_000698 [Juglans regia]
MKNSRCDAMVMEKKEEPEEDDRREAVIASAPSLQSNFEPKGGITQAQLSKFQELHRRRLQIKSKTKTKKTSRGSGGRNGKSHSKDIVQDCADEDSTIAIEESGVSDSERHNNKNNSSFQQNNLATPIGSKQRQKLHWGLDTKERWERKANM